MKKGCLAHLIISWLFAGILAVNLCAGAEGLKKHGVGSAQTGPLQTFTVKDYLQHLWTNEIIHFPICFEGQRAPESLTLTDAAGRPVPCQVTGLAQQNGKVTGTAWTLVSLARKGQAAFQLRPGTPAPALLRLVSQGQDYLLSNEFIVLRLPRLPGALTPPVDLSCLPAPLLSVSIPGSKSWLGQGTWINADRPLQVKEATTSVIEEGPVRVTVRYKLTCTDGRFYQADITLGDRQECALLTDASNLDAPKAAFRFSFQPGLGADRVYWRNNYFADQSKGLTPGPIAFDKEETICKLRPWSFWWLKDLTAWAGFYKNGAAPFVGVLALRDEGRGSRHARLTTPIAALRACHAWPTFAASSAWTWTCTCSPRPSRSS